MALSISGEAGAGARLIDRQFVVDCVDGGHCCAMVGLSNVGKSDLMRSLASAEVSPPALFVYIDFNLMLNVTEQGFYELILRSVLAALEESAVSTDLLEQVRQAYHGIVSPSSSFAVALSFSAGLSAVVRGLGRRLVLLCDEFDEPFLSLDGRVFLNLRALRDRDPQGIIYVSATGRRLSEMRQDHGASEFAELFAHSTHFVRPLGRADAVHLACTIASAEGTHLDTDDLDFAWAQAGGHPGLLEVTSRILIQAHQTGANKLPEDQRLSHVHRLLDNDLNARTECAKLWNDLSEEERTALMRFLIVPSGQGLCEACEPLLERGIIVQTTEGGPYAVFGGLFRDFADRQRLITRSVSPGLRIDVDAGDVWVDGRLLPDLTAQEYRLLLLLYGNIDKICDKGKIVEAVWSEAYMDDVDDARIEKLVSRLRQKIEPSPDEPRYLLTIRGRGYKLASGG